MEMRGQLVTPAVNAAAIETRGLVKRFGDVVALDALDLTVPGRGIYGFLGPNGAGKTTTIRVLLGLITATQGSAWLFGEAVRPMAPVLRRVGALVERPAFYPYLSARDNLRLLAAARGLSSESAARTAEALDRVGLGDVARRKVGGFSTGMRQRLGIAAALLDRPDLVVLDEPTVGLDPGGMVEVRELIGSIAADGASVFLSSHLLAEVEHLCDRVAILQRGKVIAEGETTALLAGHEALVVRFETAEEARRATDVLGAMAAIETISAGPDPSALVVAGAAVRGSEVTRLLAERSLYPAELRLERPTLEAVFMELTANETPSTGPGRAA